MRLWQDITHKDYENTKIIWDQLLRQQLASQPSPEVWPFPLSSANAPDYTPNIATHAESTELSPLATKIPSYNISSYFSHLRFFPASCKNLQILTMWDKQI